MKMKSYYTSMMTQIYVESVKVVTTLQKIKVVTRKLIA